MRGRDGGDGGGPIFGVAHGAHGQDVVLQQLKDDAELEARRNVAEARSGHRICHKRPCDHDLWQHTQPVEVLLPVATADLVIDEHDERDVERLAPADYDLPVDQAVIDAVQRQGHVRGTRIALPPASTARRAASAGGMSRLNTKSSNMARLTPVTTAMSAPPCFA